MMPSMVRQAGIQLVSTEELGEESSGGAAAVQAVGVAFEIVECLADAGEGIGVTEVAKRLGHTKARVHRHLVTLRRLGFVEQDASTDAYRLGWKIHRLGMAVAESFGLRKLAQRHLSRLQAVTGQTVVLAAPAGPEVSIVDAMQGTGDFMITVRPGAVLAPTSSALGRAMLAFQAESVLNPLFAADGLPLSERGPTRKELDRTLARVRKEWYDLASNERLPGVTALACPVFDRADVIAGAVAIVSPGDVFTATTVPELVLRVQACARAISHDLGSRAWEDHHDQADPETPA